MVLLNPTLETFEMQYGGISYSLEPGDKMKADPAMANHLVNAFGPRGLCSLDFGDDEKKISADGRKRNFDFKTDYVTKFNIRNENRKMQGLGYTPPSDKCKEYAKELAIELLAPYAAKDTQVSEISQLKAENSKMLNLLTSMSEKYDKIMSALEKVPDSEELVSELNRPDRVPASKRVVHGG
jgi:hypothetical protein